MELKAVLDPVLAVNSTTIKAGDPNTTVPGGFDFVKTHALVMDSPALESGDPTICAAAPVNNLDQRGVSRPQPLDTNCDIGSFESDIPAPMIMLSDVVNTLVDENDTTPNGTCSLREAIIANNTDADFGGCADPQGTITFENSLMGTITNSALPAISQSVEIQGPGSSTLTVSGNNQFRVFDIGSNLNVTIDGLTITQGSTSDSGGGIQSASDTTLTVSSSTLIGNSAEKFGGGIRATKNTNLIVTNSTLSGNSTGSSGGGIPTTPFDSDSSNLSCDCIWPAPITWQVDLLTVSCCSFRILRLLGTRTALGELACQWLESIEVEGEKREGSTRQVMMGSKNNQIVI